MIEVVEMAHGSPFLVHSFSALTIVMAFMVALLCASARKPEENRSLSSRALFIALAALTLWLALTYMAAARGMLHFDGRPPTIFLLIAPTIALSLWIATGRVGRRLSSLPLALLVGVQAFRFPLELIMHRAALEGVMPPQMTYTGRNFDIATGIGAALLALFLAWRGESPAGRRLTFFWNVAGLLLLLNVIVIAVLSSPTPLRMFHNEPSNIWITTAPYVWLPTFLVQLALIGHIVIFRRLRAVAPER